jgi:Protein of unknown function (DUF1488)
MALETLRRPTYVNAQGVHFAMLHGATTIRIIVTRATLQGEGSTLEENAFLTRFDAYRDVYEIVAKRKFKTGDFKGSMAITPDDLAEFMSERPRDPLPKEVAR